MPRQPSEVWPPLPFDAWRDTQATLHRWTQVVGKVKLATTPFQNEWWNVAFSVTSTGITTGLMPYGNEAFSIDFDFVDHNLYVRVSDGQTKTMSLLPRSVAEFYAEIFAVLGSLGIDVSINPLPVEIVDPVEFHMDHENESYDADAVHRWWRIQMQTAKVMQRYQTPFGGKSSPVMFFWGSFDLAVVRFSGRPASLPEDAPNFMQLAEDQENFAVGFWPGNDNYAGIPLGEPGFNAYIFPEPDGFKEATVRPDAAYYHDRLGQFILPFEAARHMSNPGETILSFYQSVYEAAATLAYWDRAALELDRIP
ncbi:MAG: DUF5996 family protein [Chloroflexota bacterium]|nr:DUF5996 family protein [Chloroflexota bacterium]